MLCIACTDIEINHFRCTVKQSKTFIFSSCYSWGTETQNAWVMSLCPTGVCNRAGIPTHLPIFKASAPSFSAAFILNTPWTPARILQALLGHIGIRRSPSAHVAIELWAIWSLMQQLHKTVHPVRWQDRTRTLKGKTGREKTSVRSLLSICTEKTLQFFYVSCKCSSLLFFPNCEKLSVLKLL